MDGYLTTSLQELKDTEVQFAQEIKWLLFRVKPELSQKSWYTWMDSFCYNFFSPIVVFFSLLCK
jgi:hypothetical protein